MAFAAHVQNSTNNMVMRMSNDQEITQEQIEEEREEIHARLRNTMENVATLRDTIAKQEAMTACREAFMTITENPMEKFGLPLNGFSDARTLLDWADLVTETFI